MILYDSAAPDVSTAERGVRPFDLAARETRRKVLIVKFGYGETLDPDSNGVVSLGDVLRTTVLLNAYPAESCHVTWLVDPKAAPLLAGNPRIDRLVEAERRVPYSIRAESFDVVVNLEKEPGLCAEVDALRARQYFGFRYDRRSGRTDHHEHAAEAMTMCLDPSFKRQQTRSWSDLLYGMIGRRYEGERYVFADRPAVPLRYHFGLNHLVGSKFPLKRWPEANWNILHDALAPSHMVSWQQGENDLDAYIRWIASCRVLVTNDSLGLHLALALGTPAVALFGPTRASEIEDGETLIKLTARDRQSCLGCEGMPCERGRPCVAGVSVAEVRGAAVALLRRVARAA